MTSGYDVIGTIYCELALDSIKYFQGNMQYIRKNGEEWEGESTRGLPSPVPYIKAKSRFEKEMQQYKLYAVPTIKLRSCNSECFYWSVLFPIERSTFYNAKLLHRMCSMSGVK